MGACTDRGGEDLSPYMVHDGTVYICERLFQAP